MSRKIVITGCCGTIGQGLLEVLAERADMDAVLGIDNNESGLFALSQTYSGPFSFVFGDVRDERRLETLFAGVDTVIHTAALKHVSSCELSPTEAVKTNVLGVTNVIAAARAARVGKVLFTSSDKAVNPTNVMGTSKLMGERLMSAAQADASSVIFSSTRFGNVLGSHGSVFPLFLRQIAAGGPVTVTDPDMTRFVMNTREAVNLVLESVELALGGEVFVSRMRALRIGDLARVMIDRLAPVYGRKPADIAIRIIGSRPGEKLYEELLTEEESGRTLHLNKFYVILPAFRDLYSIEYRYADAREHPRGEIYRSSEQPLMSPEEIAAYLEAGGLLPPVCAREGSDAWTPKSIF